MKNGSDGPEERGSTAEAELLGMSWIGRTAPDQHSCQGSSGDSRFQPRKGTPAGRLRDSLNWHDHALQH